MQEPSVDNQDTTSWKDVLILAFAIIGVITTACFFYVVVKHKVNDYIDNRIDNTTICWEQEVDVYYNNNTKSGGLNWNPPITSFSTQCEKIENMNNW